VITRFSASRYQLQISKLHSGSGWDSARCAKCSDMWLNTEEFWYVLYLNKNTKN